eukprot:364710-Chlamydomonas_euryale.AAC.3
MVRAAHVLACAAAAAAAASFGDAFAAHAACMHERVVGPHPGRAPAADGLAACHAHQQARLPVAPGHAAVASSVRSLPCAAF